MREPPQQAVPGRWSRSRGASRRTVETGSIAGEIGRGFIDGRLDKGRKFEVCGGRRRRGGGGGETDAREDDEGDAEEDEHELQDGHALLEDDLVGQQAEAGG